MALFIKSTKTTVTSIDGDISFVKFITPQSQGTKQAIKIYLTGENGYTYAINLYGDELKKLKKELENVK